VLWIKTFAFAVLQTFILSKLAPYPFYPVLLSASPGTPLLKRTTTLLMLVLEWKVDGYTDTSIYGMKVD
jgi:hypothetical protein